ncbi:hypothetical protein [Pantoea sp. Aalb]
MFIAVAINKCTVMTLFLISTDIFGYQVYILLTEKEMNVEIE